MEPITTVIIISAIAISITCIALIIFGIFKWRKNKDLEKREKKAQEELKKIEEQEKELQERLDNNKMEQSVLRKQIKRANQMIGKATAVITEPSAPPPETPPANNNSRSAVAAEYQPNNVATGVSALPITAETLKKLATITQNLQKCAADIQQKEEELNELLQKNTQNTNSNTQDTEKINELCRKLDALKRDREAYEWDMEKYQKQLDASLEDQEEDKAIPDTLTTPGDKWAKIIYTQLKYQNAQLSKAIHGKASNLQDIISESQDILTYITTTKDSILKNISYINKGFREFLKLEIKNLSEKIAYASRFATLVQRGASLLEEKKASPTDQAELPKDQLTNQETNKANDPTNQETAPTNQETNKANDPTAELPKDQETNKVELPKDPPTNQETDQVTAPTNQETNKANDPTNQVTAPTNQETDQAKDQSELRKDQPTNQETAPTDQETDQETDQVTNKAKDPTANQAKDQAELSQDPTAELPKDPPTNQETDQVTAPTNQETDQVTAPTNQETDQVTAPTNQETDQVKAPTNQETDQVTDPTALQQKCDQEKAKLQKMRLAEIMNLGKQREALQEQAAQQLAQIKKLKNQIQEETSTRDALNNESSLAINSLYDNPKEGKYGGGLYVNCKVTMEQIEASKAKLNALSEQLTEATNASNDLSQKITEYTTKITEQTRSLLGDDTLLDELETNEDLNNILFFVEDNFDREEKIVEQIQEYVKQSREIELQGHDSNSEISEAIANMERSIEAYQKNREKYNKMSESLPDKQTLENEQNNDILRRLFYVQSLNDMLFTQIEKVYYPNLQKFPILSTVEKADLNAEEDITYSQDELCQIAENSRKYFQQNLNDSLLQIQKYASQSVLKEDTIEEQEMLILVLEFYIHKITLGILNSQKSFTQLSNELKNDAQSIYDAQVSQLIKTHQKYLPLLSEMLELKQNLHISIPFMCFTLRYYMNFKEYCSKIKEIVNLEASKLSERLQDRRDILAECMDLDRAFPIEQNETLQKEVVQFNHNLYESMQNSITSLNKDYDLENCPQHIRESYERISEAEAHITQRLMNRIAFIEKEIEFAKEQFTPLTDQEQQIKIIINNTKDDSNKELLTTYSTKISNYIKQVHDLQSSIDNIKNSLNNGDNPQSLAFALRSLQIINKGRETANLRALAIDISCNMEFHILKDLMQQEFGEKLNEPQNNQHKATLETLQDRLREIALKMTNISNSSTDDKEIKILQAEWATIMAEINKIKVTLETSTAQQSPKTETLNQDQSDATVVENSKTETKTETLNQDQSDATVVENPNTEDKNLNTTQVLEAMPELKEILRELQNILKNISFKDTAEKKQSYKDVEQHIASLKENQDIEASIMIESSVMMYRKIINNAYNTLRTRYNELSAMIKQKSITWSKEQVGYLTTLKSDVNAINKDYKSTCTADPTLDLLKKLETQLVQIHNLTQIVDMLQEEHNKQSELLKQFSETYKEDKNYYETAMKLISTKDQYKYRMTIPDQPNTIADLEKYQETCGKKLAQLKAKVSPNKVTLYNQINNLNIEVRELLDNINKYDQNVYSQEDQNKLKAIKTWCTTNQTTFKTTMANKQKLAEVKSKCQTHKETYDQIIKNGKHQDSETATTMQDVTVAELTPSQSTKTVTQEENVTKPKQYATTEQKSELIAEATRQLAILEAKSLPKQTASAIKRILEIHKNYPEERSSLPITRFHKIKESIDKIAKLLAQDNIDPDKVHEAYGVPLENSLHTVGV